MYVCTSVCMYKCMCSINDFHTRLAFFESVRVIEFGSRDLYRRIRGWWKRWGHKMLSYFVKWEEAYYDICLAFSAPPLFQFVGHFWAIFSKLTYFACTTALHTLIWNFVNKYFLLKTTPATSASGSTNHPCVRCLDIVCNTKVLEATFLETKCCCTRDKIVSPDLKTSTKCPWKKRSKFKIQSLASLSLWCCKPQSLHCRQSLAHCKVLRHILSFSSHV